MMTNHTHNAIHGALFVALILASVFAVATSASAAVTSAERNVTDSVEPGGEVTVTVTTTVTESNPVVLTEDFSGPVAGGQLDGVTIDGQEAGSTDFLTPTVVDSTGAAISLQESAVSAGDEIVFEYTITATADAAGQDISISGSVASGDQVTLTDDTVSVRPPTLVTGPPQDRGGDGLYEDVRGDDNFNILDVQALFNNLDNPALQNNAEAFKFQENSASEEVTVLDVQALFNDLQE
jgi:hypothetical protein